MKSYYLRLVPSRKLKENDHMTGRIMVVDDDSALRMTLQEILMDEGRDVISAADGWSAFSLVPAAETNQAIQMATEGEIALILMDIQMPGMNGVEAFLEIKEIRPDCVVAMMTGYAADSLAQQAIAEGAMAILQKPLSIEQLLEIVNEVVAESIPY